MRGGVALVRVHLCNIACGVFAEHENIARGYVRPGAQSRSAQPVSGPTAQRAQGPLEDRPGLTKVAQMQFFNLIHSARSRDSGHFRQISLLLHQ